MDQVKAITKKDKYKTIITSDDHTIIADEPFDLDGQNLGMNPGELLCSSLASCTSITLRMYSDRKEWNVSEIEVNVELNKEDKDNTFLARKVLITGKLDEKQQSRMLAIANACPIHKLLEKGIAISTEIEFKN